jgi:putative transposase
VFLTAEDRAEYLRLLREQCDLHGVRILSYCLMTNHVHLVAVPEEAGDLARGIGEAHKRYTRYVNFREGVRGYLFQGRFFSCPLDRRHLVAALRYVERNPVRAGLVARAWDYRWSSAAYHVGMVEKDALVEGRGVENLIGEHDWKDLLKTDPSETPFLRRATRTGRPCGDNRFIARAEKCTGRRLHRLKPGPKPKKEHR